MDETQAEEEEGLSEVEDDQCKNCWWDESVIRVFDPYRHLSIGCRGGKEDLVEAVLDGECFEWQRNKSRKLEKHWMDKQTLGRTNPHEGQNFFHLGIS